MTAMRKSIIVVVVVFTHSIYFYFYKKENIRTIIMCNNKYQIAMKINNSIKKRCKWYEDKVNYYTVIPNVIIYLFSILNIYHIFVPPRKLIKNKIEDHIVEVEY